MKNNFILLVMLMSFSAFAQMKVKINGAPVAQGATVKAETITSFEVAFANPKKLDYYGLGLMYVYVDFDNVEINKESVEEFVLQKKGQNTMQMFIDEPNAFEPLPIKAESESRFRSWFRYQDGPATLENILKRAIRKSPTKLLKVRTALVYRERTGYNAANDSEQYGEALYLVKEFTFNIDVSAYYDAVQAELAAEKKAEEEKAAANKKKERGRQLKRILGI